MSGYKTILDAASELGMTKNALKYWLRKCPPEESVRDEQGRILLSDSWIAFIRENRVKPPENRAEVPLQEPKTPVLLPSALSDTMELLREQLAAKDAQIEALTSALRGEQALHAQTRQDLTAAREELRLLQAPKESPQGPQEQDPAPEMQQEEPQEPEQEPQKEPSESLQKPDSGPWVRLRKLLDALKGH